MIREDAEYRPSSPEQPGRRFYIETGAYRWEVYVWRYEIKETGTPVYYARTDEGHSAYGMTVNEPLNDLAAIMGRKLELAKQTRTVTLDEVRNYLDPYDAAAEDVKVARSTSARPLAARLFGFWRG